MTQFRAAGRIHDRTSYLNARAGFRLDLPNEWRAVSPFEPQSLVSFNHRDGALLEVFLEGRRGETLQDHANAAVAVYNARHLDAQPATIQPAHLGDRPALQIVQEYVLADREMMTGSRALRSDWLCEHRGLVLRLVWRQGLADGSKQHPRALWKALCSAVSFPEPGEPSGGAPPPIEPREDALARLKEAGRIEAGRYVNPALGITFACPWADDPSDDPKLLYRSAQSAGGPRVEVHVFLLPVIAHPQTALSRILKSNAGFKELVKNAHGHPDAVFRSLTVQGRLSAEATWRGWVGDSQVTYWTRLIPDHGRVFLLEWMTANPDPVGLKRLQDSFRFTNP